MAVIVLYLHVCYVRAWLTLAQLVIVYTTPFRKTNAFDVNNNKNLELWHGSGY